MIGSRLSSLCCTCALALCLLGSGTSSARDIVVNPAHPRASDTGIGHADQPFRTIASALKGLRPGDHLVIASGTFREPILLPNLPWTGAAETVIEGDPNGGTLIKGSQVLDGWRPAGPERFEHAIAAQPQQVFVDGVPLQQIGGTVWGGYPERADHYLASLHVSQGGVWPGRRPGDRASMPPNSFHYDPKNGTVMIRVSMNSLDGHRVEVSVLPQLLAGTKLERVTVRNLRFEHSNTTTTLRGGAVQLEGKRLRISGVQVRRADGVCFGINGEDVEIKASSFNECGRLGMGGRGTRFRIVDSETSGNNTRGFNKWWEAGGAKFVGDGGLSDSEIVRHKATNNLGDGLWFDWNNRNNRVTDSLLAFNTGFGLHVEASHGFLIDNNVAVANRQRGIYLPHSSNNTVAFNLSALNGLEGIVIIDEGPQDPKKEGDSRARGNRVMGNVIAWNRAALTIPANIADSQSDFNVFVGDRRANQLTAGWKGGRGFARNEWNSVGLDVHSQWVEGDAADRPLIDASRPLGTQLAWYRELRVKLHDLPGSVVRNLDPRLMESRISGDTAPGPTYRTWLSQ